MLTMLGSRRQFCDGITRRETLKVGALSVLGGEIEGIQPSAVSSMPQGLEQLTRELAAMAAMCRRIIA